MLNPKVEAVKEKQKEYYDRSAKPFPPFSVRDNIHYQEEKTWIKGIVTEEEGYRSYTMKSTDEAVYRRNRRHLIQSGEKLTKPRFQYCLSFGSYQFAPLFSKFSSVLSTQPRTPTGD